MGNIISIASSAIASIVLAAFRANSFTFCLGTFGINKGKTPPSTPGCATGLFITVRPLSVPFSAAALPDVNNQ